MPSDCKPASTQFIKLKSISPKNIRLEAAVLRKPVPEGRY